MILRLHSFLPLSRATGPGLRAAVWVQGCSLGCPGCFNRETHPNSGGELIAVADLAAEIGALRPGLEGITISGGEPLQQRPAVFELIRRLKKDTALSVILFTGFTWEEVSRVSDTGPEFLQGVDVLIAGRYDRSQRVARGMRGSANQTLHCLTDRYSLADLSAVPEAEIVIDRGGNVIFSGIETLHS